MGWSLDKKGVGQRVRLLEVILTLDLQLLAPDRAKEKGERR